MASLLDLANVFWDPQAPPPALQLGNIALARDQAISDQTMREGVIAENMPWKLSDIATRRAAGGIGRHSQTTGEMGHAIQLANQEVGQGRYELNKTLQNLARNRFLTTLGMPLGSQF
jgi:hypothetical protein